MSEFSIADADAAEVIFETIGDPGTYTDHTLAEPVDCTMILNTGVQPNAGYTEIVESIDTLSFRLAEVRPRGGGRATLNGQDYSLVELLTDDGVEQTWQVRKL